MKDGVGAVVAYRMNLAIALQVTKISQKSANVNILSVGQTLLKEPFPGIIRYCTCPRVCVRYVECMCIACACACCATLLPSVLTHLIGAACRARDVRAFEIDTVEMYKCFRPNDIVRAGVVCSKICVFHSMIAGCCGL